MFTLRKNLLRWAVYLEQIVDIATQEMYNSQEATHVGKIVWLLHFLDYFDLVCTRATPRSSIHCTGIRIPTFG